MRSIPETIGRGTILLATACAVAACNGGDGIVEPIHELPRQLSVAEQNVIRNTNEFGFDLFARVHHAEAGPNVFISPLSASFALAMTLNGAAAGTWDGMRTALQLQGLSEDEINASFSALMRLLVELDPRVTLRIGNSVWAKQGVPFEAGFYDRVREFYDAEARELDFGDPASLDIINDWASQATNGRIDKVLQEIRPEHIMFLMNAIYFKGQWEQQFDAGRTKPAPFQRATGASVDVPMMHLPMKNHMPYAHTSDYEAVELAYGGTAFSAVFVLPAPGRSLAELVSSLDAESWNTLVEDLDSTKLDVRIPRFRLSYEVLLNDALKDLGMATAFSNAADFTRLTPLAREQPVCIEFVKQNTFLEVNEEGTEAAAVTTVGISTTSLPPSFTADRPFLLVIRERLSGTILFMGAIGDPTAEEGEPVQMPQVPCTPQ